MWRPADAAAGRAGRDARLGARRLTGDRYVATHSPILLATPDARIYELDGGGVAPCGYDDLEAVRLTRGFLDAPERFTRAALDET